MTVPESHAHLAPLAELAATQTTINAADTTVVQRRVVRTFFEFVMSASSPSPFASGQNCRHYKPPIAELLFILWARAMSTRR